MSKEIKKIDSEKLALQQEEIKRILFEEHDCFLQEGDLIMTSYGIYPIEKISIDKEKNIYIHYTYTSMCTHEDGKVRPYTQKTKTSIKDFLYYSSYYKIEGTREELNKDVIDIISGISTVDELLNSKFGTSKEESSSREVMVQNKDVLQEKKLQMIRKRDFVQSRMESMQKILDNKRRDLYRIKEEMDSVIKRMNKLIYQLEIYLGISESIYQVQSGLPASDNDPVCLRQRLMYMDVECGDPSNEGIDFKNIQDFIDWLLCENAYWKKKNLDILIPESKCVTMFRVRKKMKDYRVNNPFLQCMLDEENKKTYIFIRNGDNVYMIESEVNFGDRLFPGRDEISNLIDEGEKSHWERDRKAAENAVFNYKLNIILLQGLIERTEIFPKEKYTINLFDVTTYDERTVRFIYDDDESSQLPSGIKTFPEWRKELNKGIVAGSRVFVIKSLIEGTSWQYRNENKVERLFKSRYEPSHYNLPDYPNSGLYQVFLSKNNKIYNYYTNDESKKVQSIDILFIKYNPKDEVRTGWSRYDYDKDYTRKNNLSFAIYQEDNFLINYDAITNIGLKELEFYMYTRIGREEYLSYIPMLMEIYKHKKEELQKEKMFIGLVLSTIKWEQTKLNEVKVFKEVKWWKLKNKWKRGLTVDETKALRMIVKRLKQIHK